MSKPASTAEALARDFHARIRANLREILAGDPRTNPEIAASAWPSDDPTTAARKLNRLTTSEGNHRSSSTTFKTDHAAALAEALGVDPGDFYEAG